MFERINRIIKKIITVLLPVICLHTIAGMVQQGILQKGISEEVIRFHVLANSDSRADQAVKLQVRDAVLAWAYEQQPMPSRQESAVFLQQHIPEMKKIADQVLNDSGFPYKAAVEWKTCYFPERTYGTCTFPAGWYDALRIELGEAKGKNWWCVFFPQLCFADYLHAVVGEEQEVQLKEVLTVDEYEKLLQEPGEWRIAFRWIKRWNKKQTQDMQSIPPCL